MSVWARAAAVRALSASPVRARTHAPSASAPPALPSSSRRSSTSAGAPTPTPTLANILLLTREVEAALQLYHGALGLPVLARDADASADLDAGAGVRLSLARSEQEAALCTGYSPFLNFEVDDFDATIYRLLACGARLDGPVKYPLQGKVAALRTPDGHMIGLVERGGSSL